jgi:hypothetical protein
MQPFTGYGTRHRSAFRFVESMNPAVAFIQSQDGGIKAATLVGDRVVMWSYSRSVTRLRSHESVMVGAITRSMNQGWARPVEEHEFGLAEGLRR